MSKEAETTVGLSLRFMMSFMLTVVGLSFTAGRLFGKVIALKLQSGSIQVTFDEVWKLAIASAPEQFQTIKVENQFERERQEIADQYDNYAYLKNKAIIPGRQLLVDIENVNNAFLNSPRRLIQAIEGYVEQHQDEEATFMLPPTCNPMSGGYFCLAFTSAGHRITVNTWPLDGVVSISILINDSEESLISEVALVEEEFAVPRREPLFSIKFDEPIMRWASKPRGFFEILRDPNQLDINVITSLLDVPVKEKVFSGETDFQQIDIWDVLHHRLGSPRFLTNMRYEALSYEAQNPEIFRPDRVVYLDGVVQSRYYGEAAYHDCLVHPGLFAHPNPRRVAIIGGGEGATLREALKHKTVETVTMVEIDEEMVEVSREFLPEWSDCSFLEGSADSCFDDPRSEVFFTDAVAWFLTRFGRGASEEFRREPYDVIIMDALDPDSYSPFSDVLYNNEDFANALYSALTKDGILVIQTGGSPDSTEVPAEFLGEHDTERALMRHLKHEGFVQVYDYQDAQSGFSDAWTFLACFKSWKGAKLWFSNQAQIDLEVEKRAMPTKTGELPFRYFDGSVMKSLQLPLRISTDYDCRAHGIAQACSENLGFDPYATNKAVAQLGDLNGSEASGSYVGLEVGVNTLDFLPSTIDLMSKLFIMDAFPDAVKRFIDFAMVPTCFHGYKSGIVDFFDMDLAKKVKDRFAEGLMCDAPVFMSNLRDAYSRQATKLHRVDSAFLENDITSTADSCQADEHS